MAQLRKRGKCYSAYVRKYVNGKYITYETFHFGRIKKDEAKDRRSRINKAEWKIINGEITPEDYPTWFPWLNDKGIYEELRVRTLGETIDEFLEYKSLEIRESSVKRIRISMDRLQEVIKPSTNLAAIKTKHIAIDYRKHFKDIHRPAGMNANLRNIKTFFRWCYDMEYMDRIPKIVIHKVDTGTKYLTEKEIIKVLEACTPFYRSVFRVYLETGKRRSELIRSSLEGTLLAVPVAEGLKKKEAHYVELNSRQVKVIKALHKDRDEYVAAINPRTKKPFLLESYIGRYTDVFTAKLKEVGIYEKYRTKLHSLRHSQGVMTYLKANDIKSVMDKLDHTEIDTALLYSKIKTNEVKNAFPSAYEYGEVAKKVQENAECDTFVRQLRHLD